MSQAVSVPLSVVLVAALIAAVTDVWKFKVYNVLTLPLMAAGLLYHGVVGGMAGLSDGAVGLLVGFGALILPHLMGGMGAGDVKLMAAIGAWLGMPLTLHVVLASALAAGAYAVVLALAGGKLRQTILDVQVLWLRLTSMGRFPAADDRVQAETRRADRRRRLVPFAAMVAVGVVATLVWSEYPSTR